MRLGLMLAVLAGAVLAGCGDEPMTFAADRPPLTGTTWDSVGVTENGRPRELAEGTRIELTFRDGRITAKAGCNGISGPVTVTSDRLEVGELMQTDMGCDPARMAQDQWLADFLGATPTWRQNGDELALSTNRTRIDLERRSPFPLIGTRWELAGLVDGSSVSSLPQGVEAFLTFDGTRVTGSAGCNRLTAPATIAGNEVTLGGIATTKMACGGPPDEVERAVLGTLTTGTVKAEIDGGTLRLTGARTGLILTATP